MNQPLADMFRYNSWANLTLLNACQSLSREQLEKIVPGISGSVAELLTHLVSGQQTFILRTKGRQHEGEMHRNTPWPGFKVLIEAARSTNDELIQIAEELDVDREVGLEWQDQTYNLPVSFLLTHALEHGVEHRTEIKVALNLMGIETPDLDGWSYAVARGIMDLYFLLSANHHHTLVNNIWLISGSLTSDRYSYLLPIRFVISA